MKTEQKKRRKYLRRLRFIVAGAEGLEPATNGFGDRYSTN